VVLCVELIEAVSQVLRGLHLRELCNQRLCYTLWKHRVMQKMKQPTSGCIRSHCIEVIFLVLFHLTFSCLRVCRVCRRQKKRSFRSLIFSYFGILCSVSLSSTFFSVCDGFGEMTSASLSHYLSFLFFFSTSSHCSPIYFLFLLSACSSQSLMSLLNYPASAPSICPSVLLSFLLSFLPFSLPCDASLSGRPVRLQELWE